MDQLGKRFLHPLNVLDILRHDSTFSRLGIQKGTSPRFLLHGAYILVESNSRYGDLFAVIRKERYQDNSKESDCATPWMMSVIEWDNENCRRCTGRDEDSFGGDVQFEKYFIHVIGDVKYKLGYMALESEEDSWKALVNRWGLKPQRSKPTSPGKRVRSSTLNLESLALRVGRMKRDFKKSGEIQEQNVFPAVGLITVADGRWAWAFMTRMCVSGDNTGTGDGLGNGVSFRQTVMLSMDHWVAER